MSWLVTGGMLIAILPFTKLLIMPLNNELIAVEETKEKGMLFFYIFASHLC